MPEKQVQKHKEAKDWTSVLNGIPTTMSKGFPTTYYKEGNVNEKPWEKPANDICRWTLPIPAFRTGMEASKNFY